MGESAFANVELSTVPIGELIASAGKLVDELCDQHTQIASLHSTRDRRRNALIEQYLSAGTSVSATDRMVAVETCDFEEQIVYANARLRCLELRYDHTLLLINNHPERKNHS